MMVILKLELCILYLKNKKGDFKRVGGHGIPSQVSQTEEKNRRWDDLRPLGVCQVSSVTPTLRLQSPKERNPRALPQP